ncbi:MAG: signal peptidase II [Candidatus Moranbacteria bacterium]|nr:signal peptidase II [Candidatus Moranbacteria bacterium]
MPTGTKKTPSLLLLLIVVLADQLSKHTIRRSGGFYICNHGIAFGIPIPSELFYLAWGIIIVSILIFRKRISRNSIFPVMFVLSGAISNIIDRIRFGCVTDFIDLHIWPVFNLADISITLGALLILMSWAFRKPR